MRAADHGIRPMPLHVVLDALLEPVILTDADGVTTFANAVAMERLGARKYIGLPLADHAEHGEMLTADGQRLGAGEHPVARVLATRAPVVGVRLLVRGGGTRPATYHVNTAPLWEGDRLVGTASVFHDVTRAVALETELADHAARLEAIVNLVSDAVFVTDSEGRLLFMNAVGERLLGLPVHMAVDERARRVDLREISGERVVVPRFPSSRALAGETVAGERFVLRDADGHDRQVLMSAHPLRRADGTVYAALVTIDDVTEAARAREEIEGAREAAEEASHLKDQFIAALSHELRTPLQPILGWTEVLRRHGNLDSVTSQALEAIRRNIRQQVRLVDDLLDLSRIVHKKLALRFEIFDLREQVRSAAEPFEETAALRRVRLALALPEEPVPVWGDGARIQQVVTNLISNAVKFTPAGGHVNVQLLASGAEALLEVEDTGEGIAAEDLPVIFEAFRQGNAARRRGGLGIGLDLVKRLVELHGGTVEVASEGRGYGARFSIRLPRRLREAAALPDPRLPRRQLDDRDVLLIEDNTDTREVLRFMLEAEGARVMTASSGEEGIRLAVERRPHIVLCDIGLPDIDGLDVARHIRGDAALQRTRLIALTGYGQPEDVRHALEAGFEAHLTKPINLDQLMSLLSGF